MTRRSVTLLSAGSIIALAGSIVAASPITQGRSHEDDKLSVDGRRSAFDRAPTCDVNRAGTFLDSNRPFAGGLAGSAYGDIFFAGGGVAVAARSSAARFEMPSFEGSGSSSIGSANSSAGGGSAVTSPNTSPGKSDDASPTPQPIPPDLVPPDVAPTPEPGSLILLATGLIGGLVAGRRHFSS